MPPASLRTITALAVAAVALAVATSAQGAPLGASVLPPASAFTGNGQRNVTRTVVPQSKIGLSPKSVPQCDGTAMVVAPARDGAVEGDYFSGGHLALMDTVFRYPSVGTAQAALSAYNAVAGCRSLVNGWLGYAPQVSDVTAVQSSIVVGDETKYFGAVEAVNKKGATAHLHAAITRWGRYVILTQNYREAPMTTATVPRLAGLMRKELAAVKAGTASR